MSQICFEIIEQIMQQYQRDLHNLQIIYCLSLYNVGISQYSLLI